MEPGGGGPGRAGVRVAVVPGTRVVAPVTAAAVTHFEIARAVPAGSRRVRSQRVMLREALSDPRLGEKRADFAGHLRAVMREWVRFMSWEDGLTMPVRARVCQLVGISERTYQRCRAQWHEWGYQGTVLEGTTPEFCSFLHRDGPNQAAVYVLAVPRKKQMTTRVRDPDRITVAPPSRRRRDKNPAPAREAKPRNGPPFGRAQPVSAAAASAAAPADATVAVLRRAGGKTITEGWCGWLARPFAAAGYSAADLAWAIDHDPAGAQHRWTGRPRHPVGWLRSRLALWLDAGGNPRPSRSQQLQASRDRIAAERLPHTAFKQRAAGILAAASDNRRARDKLARQYLGGDQARLRSYGGGLAQRGAQLARDLIAERRSQPTGGKRMEFYDSVSPAKIMAGAHACLYHDGEFAATEADAERFAAVRWITVIGDWENCGIADYERGNPVFSVNDALRAWVEGRRRNHHRARVYCDRANLPEVRDQLEGLDGWELWAATLDGDVLSPDWAPNLWAVQYAGGPTANYDTSILYGEW